MTYYYLWHFSAAELALPLRASGWEADIGLTWFTAFASLTLMMGLAVWLSKDARAAILVVALAAADLAAWPVQLDIGLARADAVFGSTRMALPAGCSRPRGLRSI